MKNLNDLAGLVRNIKPNERKHWMKTEGDHYTEVIELFREKWMSKDSPKLSGRQLAQFDWLFKEIWDRAQREFKPIKR